MKQFFAGLRKLRRGGSGRRSLIDREAIEKMFERSRVPAVLMLVLVWTVTSVLLILSRERQIHLLDWLPGQKAPYSIYAATDFEYEDSAATDRKREKAKKAVPNYYRVDGSRVIGGFDAFFSRLAARTGHPAAAPAAPARAKATAESAPPAGTDKPAAEIAAAAALADRIPSELAVILDKAYRIPANRQLFDDYLKLMANRGIVGAGIGDAQLGIVGRNGNFTANSFFTVDWSADLLSGLLLPGATGERRRECRDVMKQLIGEQGDLVPDEAFTTAKREKDAATVEKVKKSKSRGELLIRKGEVYTPEMREMIEEELKATPGLRLSEAYSQAAWSFVILLVGVFSIFLLSRDTLRDNLRILLAGLTVTLALSFSYTVIKIFESLLQNAFLLDEKLLVAAMPAAFCAIVLAVVLDMRTAICAGGLVAVISAMMVIPSRALELALRWMAISSFVALSMRKVSNSRSFFKRTVVSVLVVTWVLNLDLVFWGRTWPEVPQVLKEAALVILGNALVCWMLAQLTVFVFELFFNLSNDMALTVLVLGASDHPLLERLKREAPRTMSHSTDVATLAEDAARAIGANPLRAKAGALFHDIGKLSKPQYFTENNSDSSQLHAKLKPEESARIIRDHVTDGVALARQYRLCRFIRSVISSHHGDGLVSFFYKKALEESKKSGAPVREEDFRYRGEPPRTREEGIISLADACEAARRSMEKPTPEKIAELVGNIVQGRFRDGMLRNSRLTAEELDKLQKSFVSTLSSMEHGRIAYPGGTAPAKDDGK